MSSKGLGDCLHTSVPELLISAETIKYLCKAPECLSPWEFLKMYCEPLQPKMDSGTLPRPERCSLQKARLGLLGCLTIRGEAGGKSTLSGAQLAGCLPPGRAARSPSCSFWAPGRDLQELGGDLSAAELSRRGLVHLLPATPTFSQKWVQTSPMTQLFHSTWTQC